MTAIDLITALPKLDICLWTDGENLKYQAPGELDADYAAELKEHKSEVIELLSGGTDAFLVTGYQCDCGNDLYIPKAYIWLGLQDEPRYGYQCVSCGTRYRFV